MGLDQWLHRKEFLKNKTERTQEIQYWRKENHIHKYFTDFIAEYYDHSSQEVVIATVDDLKDLLYNVNQILSEHDTEKQQVLAEGLLPTQEGFFFGGTEYDEYYFDSLVNLKSFLVSEISYAEKIEEGLDDEVDSVEYVYSCWW